MIEFEIEQFLSNIIMTETQSVLILQLGVSLFMLQARGVRQPLRAQRLT